MDPAIATIYGAIIGAVLTGPVSYFFTTRIARRQHENAVRLAKTTEFNKAAATFLSAFTEEKRKLQETDTQNPHEFLGCGYVRHWSAVIQFLPYLCEVDRPRLQKAWDAYKKAYHDHDFSSQGGGKDKVRSCAEKALSHIDSMHRFAVFK